MELSDKDFRIIMLNTFKEIKGKAENLDRELEIIKHSRTGTTITKIKTSVYQLNIMLQLKEE